MNIAKIVRITAKVVFMVLLRVEFKAILRTSLNGRFRYNGRNSLVLSKTITVSLTENPITVRIAAINDWSISIENGIIPQNIEYTPITRSTSWNNDITAPKPYCQYLN